jgi:NAD(P)H-dependent flavin oxidoreductase YrpB (nitropropane dioxygenase family)
MKEPDPVTPKIIQGGMGFYISSPFLANAVARSGGLGTVSGVAPELVLAIKLQSGDAGGHFRRALSQFPFPHIAQMVLDAYFVEESDPRRLKPRRPPVFNVQPSPLLIALSVCANFSFVWLAREGHENPVSINYLEKIAMPHVYAFTGAMLAGVDYLTMGAGIPLQIPEAINALMEGRPVTYRISVEGETVTGHQMCFDPEAFLGGKLPPLKRPRFLPIISSNVLANVLMQRLPAGSVYGFIIEEPTAGGHNAPPRGQFAVNGEREPVYGPRDIVDYSKISRLGLPFWIAGSKASPEMLRWALSAGASGIQVGTAFALCEQSGMDPIWRNLVRRLGYLGTLRVKTDAAASPTGFPFKVAAVPGTLSEADIYAARERVCKHGVLTALYEKPDGSIGYRCPSEPIAIYLAKGGKLEETVERRCLCSGLLATAGLGDENEAPIITLGDDVERLMPLLMRGPDDPYDVDTVFKYLGT